MSRIDFEDDASSPSAEQLHEIGILARRQRMLEGEIANMEAKLSTLAKELRQVQEIDLPEAMLTAGCRAFTLATGESVKIEDGITASLSADKKPAACAWLREHGFGDIVSDDVLLKFGKGEEARASATVSRLVEQGLLPIVTTNVNTATLKALIKEQMAQGNDMPLDVLGAYTWRKAKIKTP